MVSTTFAEERDSTSLREKLYAEFNSLSILYGKPSSQVKSVHFMYVGREIDAQPHDLSSVCSIDTQQFVSPNYQFKVIPLEIKGSAAASHHDNSDDSLLGGGADDGDTTEKRLSSSQPYTRSSGYMGPSDDLLGKK